MSKLKFFITFGFLEKQKLYLYTRHFIDSVSKNVKILFIFDIEDSIVYKFHIVLVNCFKMAFFYIIYINCLIINLIYLFY